LPTAKKTVRDSAATGPALTAAKWQLVNPVRIDLVSGVEVGNRIKRRGRPGIDDLPTVSNRNPAAVFVLIDPLGIGILVLRLGVRVVEIKLQASEMAAQGCLHSVVAAGARSTPGEHRRELVVPVGILAKGRAGRKAICIQRLQGISSVDAIGIIKVVDVLRSSRIGWDSGSVT